MIRAIIFDLGGTLIEFNPDHLPWLEWERAGLQSAHAYLSTRGYDVPERAFERHFFEPLPERWAQATQGQTNLKLEELMRETCSACGLTPTETEIQEVVAQYIRPLDTRIELFADTLDTLEALRRRGLLLGLVSNTMWPGEYHRRELDRFGMTPYFEHTVFSADVGVWKPQPDIYHLSLDALRVSAQEAIFVGDTPQHDIVGAQGVGMRAVYKRNHALVSDTVRPDAEITHLTELLTLIEQWE